MIYTITRVRAANLPPMCFHPDSLEPIMNERMVYKLVVRKACNIQHLVVCVSLVNSCNYMYTTSLLACIFNQLHTKCMQ